MAHTYSHLYNLPTTGLRLFTVYGPWGRPDMALFMFTKSILEEKPINVFNYGKMERDFTFIDDIIMGTRACIKKNYKYEIFNLGRGKSEKLEGNWEPDRVVILEFEGIEKAKEWIDSQEYREARTLRHKTASTNMIVVEAM